MADALLVLRQWITVKERRLAGVRLLRDDHFQTSQCRLVPDLLNQFPERHILKILVGLLAQVEILLPAIVLSNDDPADTVFEAVGDDHLAGMMEVVFQPEIPLPTLHFRPVLVELLIDALDDTPVDQYWVMLI